MKIFSVHDSKAKAYLPPVTFKSQVEAGRAFEQTVKDQSSQFSKYPADFTLVELGEWSESEGRITTYEIPKIIANASEFKQ